ncbi:hypothetical protein ANRL3_02781 [Anaerolineae bacterium]|nr:hypothetical protein ANRL3_02781 [Anaerolineae bacterium]
MKATVILFGLLLIISSFDANAALDSKDVLDTILDQYKNVANTWAATITGHASKLFWELVAISMVWTFGFMALRKADIGEFFAEFIRFTLFTGFFWWLLINGPALADTIIDSMRKMGAEAAGLNNTLTPSDVVDVGFMIFDKVVSASSIMSPVNSAIGIIIALIILVIIALIAINMLLLLISG